MDPDTRIGAPAAFPQNPDSFEHFNSHANRLLDFHRFDCHHGNFKFPIAKSNWSVVTRVSHERDEESDDKHSAAVAAAQAVGNPLPPSPPQKLHFTWGLEYVYDPHSGSLKSRPRRTPWLRNGPRARVLRGDAGTVMKASVENDGTLDGVLEHRVSRNFMFKTYGLYYDAPNSSLLGMNFRFDGSIWNADLKINTDGGVGGMSAAVQPLPGTVVGTEAFYIRAEKGPIYALGVKQQLKLARWLRPSTFTFTATSLGSLVGAYSAPILSDRLRVATRFGYDLATFDSAWAFGAEMYPVRTLLALAKPQTAAAPTPAAAATAPAAAAAPAPAAAAAAASGSDPKAAVDSTSPLRDLKIQAMVDPYARYALSVSVPVSENFHAGASVSKRWTATSSDAPTIAISATYE